MATIAIRIWPRSCRFSCCKLDHEASLCSDAIPKGAHNAVDSSIQRRRREPMVAQRGSLSKTFGIERNALGL